MGMSTHVVGFVEPDEQWLKMKAVYDSCKEAGVEPPYEVESYFTNGWPEEAGAEVSIPHDEWGADMQQGIEIDVAEIPKGVKRIRFYNSY